MAKKRKQAVKRKTAKKKTTRKKTAGSGKGITSMTYSVSSDLQAVVGSGRLTRPQIVKKLWVYIKAKKCQDPKQRRMIVPDEKLARVFGSKKPVDMLKMAGLINKHIQA
jgi:DNA topoisomerase I